MRTTRFLAPTLASLVLATFATGCVIETSGDSSLEVSNESDYTIDEIYLTSAGSSSWGPNLLGGDSLFPNESLVLGADCDFYDARLVDELGAECVVRDLDLCLNDALWVVRNNTCPVFGAKLAEHLKDQATGADTNETAK